MSTQTERFFSRKSSGRYGQGIRLNQVNRMDASLGWCRFVRSECITSGPMDARLGKRLVLDELFDLSLYRALRKIAPDRLRAVLDQLIPIETKHYEFWQQFFGLELTRLGPGRRVKLWVMVGLARVFGAPAIHLILEAIEVFGIRKYLAVWRLYEGGPLGRAVREVLEDEFK